MNRKLLALPLIAVLIVAAVWLKNGRHGAPSRELVLHGNMDIRQVELAFDASGRIREMLVREGERVRQGQVLARLDTERLRLALAQAEAQEKAQEAQVERLKAGSRPEEIAQARAMHEAARAAVMEARQVYERQQELVAKHFVSQQRADSAKNALTAALQQQKAAEEALKLAELGPRKEDRVTAAQTLMAREAAVASLLHDIGEGELKAPADGIVQNRILEPGDMASPQKAVYTLALSQAPWARVYLPESALGRLPAGALAAISTDSHPERKYKAWVGYVSPTAEFTPKTVETAEVRTSLVYQARVYACEGADELRQGMPVTVTIELDQAAPASPPCQVR